MSLRYNEIDSFYCLPPPSAFKLSVQMRRLTVLEESRDRIADCLFLARIVLFMGAIALLPPANAYAQTNYQRVLSLGPTPQTGTSPREIMEGSDGWLYGATYAGGTHNSGTLFKVGKTGAGFATIFSFTNADFPYGGLVELPSGALCGTTSGGGANHAGSVFKCNKDGSGFVPLHMFPSVTNDGTFPACGLTIGKNGRLYGTTFTGGSRNCGTVFELGEDGAGYVILHNFTGATNGFDGSSPSAALRQGADGALYGTTQAGGSNDFGTIFKIQPNGGGYAIMHHFSGQPRDGRACYGALVQGLDGFLYGTTYYGGLADLGTVFRVDTNGGNYSVIRSFAAGAGGNQPFAGLTFGTNGSMYGVTRLGGANDAGAVFRMNTDGSGYVVLHSFASQVGDGAQPLAPPLFATDGFLYGSTYQGGAYTTNGASGTVFRLLSVAQVVISSITPASSGFLVSFTGGAAGAAYQIQSTTNHPVLSWRNVGTNTAAIDGTFQFLDSACTNVPSRFYRSASF